MAKMVSKEVFFQQYDKWKKKALEEFRKSEFWEDAFESAEIEITEEGDVYLGGYSWIYKVVTPWVESEFYVE